MLVIILERPPQNGGDKGPVEEDNNDGYMGGTFDDDDDVISAVDMATPTATVPDEIPSQDRSLIATRLLPMTMSPTALED